MLYENTCRKRAESEQIAKKAQNKARIVIITENQGVKMNWKTDEEIKEIVNKALKKPVERATITRWRSGSRSPKFTETQLIEQKLGIPFEAFLRNADLVQIEKNLHVLLSNLKELIKEETERKELLEKLK